MFWTFHHVVNCRTMKNAILLGSLLIQATASQAQSLDLPPRSATAPEGAEFARSIADLPLKEREERILEAVRAGNVPAFLRTLVPITVVDGTNRVDLLRHGRLPLDRVGRGLLPCAFDPVHGPADRGPARLHAAYAEDGR